MEHTEVRGTIAAGETTDEVREHLERCEACAAFADRVDRVRAQAPALVGATPPAGLADRVIEHVRSERGRGGVPAVVPFGDRLRRLRRPLLAAGSVAAVAALVAGLLVAGPGGPERAEALALAAERTGSVDTARLDLDGRAEMSVELPEVDFPAPPSMGLPDFPAPPPVPSPDLEGVPEEFREEMRRRFEEGRRRFAEEQEELRSAREEVRRRMQEELERAREALPRSFETTAVFEATGAIVLPDRLRLEGTVEQTESFRGETRTSDYEVVVVGGDAWIRNPDGTWSELPGVHGPFGPAVLDPESVARFLEVAEGVEDLGTETLDGVEVRHYRFTVPAGAFDERSDFSTTAEAWVGVDDDLVRRLRLASEGSSQGPEIDEETVRGSVSATWRTETTVRLSDFGAPVDVSPPPADAVTGMVADPGSFAVLYPFGGHVHVGALPEGTSR